jgi:predicted HicB family RNase H-like nuclease
MAIRTKSSRLNIRVQPEFLEQLQTWADTQGVSVSQWVIEATQEKAKRHKLNTLDPRRTSELRHQ